MTDAARFAVNVEVAVVRDGTYLLVERADAEAHAAGARSLVGGTVEPEDRDGSDGDVLAATGRREVREETGVEVGDVAYVTSSQFEADGTPCVNVVLVGRHESGEGRVREPDEVAAVGWYPPEAIVDDPAVPEFTRRYVERAEERRRELGW